GMMLVVKQLVFQSNGRRILHVVIFGYEVFDAAVGTFGEFEIQLQLKSTEFFGGHDIASILGFFSIGSFHAKDTIVDGPAFLRYGVFASGLSARGRFPVPQESPPVRLYVFGQVIWHGVCHKDIGGWGRRWIVGTDPDI